MNSLLILASLSATVAVVLGVPIVSKTCLAKLWLNSNVAVHRTIHTQYVATAYLVISEEILGPQAHRYGYVYLHVGYVYNVKA